MRINIVGTIEELEQILAIIGKNENTKRELKKEERESTNEIAAPTAIVKSDAGGLTGPNPQPAKCGRENPEKISPPVNIGRDEDIPPALPENLKWEDHGNGISYLEITKARPNPKPAKQGKARSGRVVIYDD